MKKTALLFCLILLSKIVLATTIVIYITPDFVILAADSKAVYTDAKTKRQSSRSVSKIYKSGKVYFSLAGLTSNNTGSLNVAAIVHESLVSTSDLMAAINKVKINVKRSLYIYLANQKKTAPSLYRNNLSEKYVTSVGLVTIKDNRPYTHLIGFIAVEKGGLKITTEEEMYKPGAEKDAVYYLGTSGEINRYMNSIQKNNLAPVEFVEKLMNLQIATTPQLVEAPIDILQLTNKQTIWVRKKKGTPVLLHTKVF